jgi:Flp pilus assembly protein TadG
MFNATRHSAQRFAGDERGNATIDFAFLLPIMLMLFVGVVEITNLLLVDRKVVAAAQTTADLVTQRREVNDAQLNDYLTAAGLIFEPFSTGAVSIGIVGVRYNSNTGAPEVDWTKSMNGGSVPNALTVAQGLGDAGEGVVVARVTYNYTPVFFDFVIGPTAIEETSVMRPRRSTYVEGPGS